VIYLAQKSQKRIRAHNKTVKTHLYSGMCRDRIRAIHCHIELAIKSSLEI